MPNWKTETSTVEGYKWYRQRKKDPLPRVLSVYWPIRTEFDVCVDTDRVARKNAEDEGAGLLVCVYEQEDSIPVREVKGEWNVPLDPPAILICDVTAHDRTDNVRLDSAWTVGLRPKAEQHD